MVKTRSGSAAAVLVLTLVGTSLGACSTNSSEPATAGVGTSKLAPERNPDRPGEKRAGARDGAVGKRAEQREARREARTSRREQRQRETRKEQRAAARRDSGGERQGGTVESPSGPTTATVGDPAGDVRGGIGPAPAHTDLTVASLTRGDAWQVRVTFAGTVPQRQQGDRVVQVATFYDLDGDGSTDYEVWASLADNGWGTSYRTPEGARFGSSSGANARAEGRDLVLTFPLGHLRSAERLGWSVGAQWGSYEQIASGTTARDTAPDGGWAIFPG